MHDREPQITEIDAEPEKGEGVGVAMTVDNYQRIPSEILASLVTALTMKN